MFFFSPIHGLIFLFKWRAGEDADGSVVRDNRLDEIFFAKQVNRCFNESETVCGSGRVKVLHLWQVFLTVIVVKIKIYLHEINLCIILALRTSHFVNVFFFFIIFNRLIRGFILIQVILKHPILLYPFLYPNS